MNTKIQRRHGRATGTEGSGFSLVELLVVVAIVGILVALVLPVLSRVRMGADIGDAQSALRNVSTAINSHMADNDMTLPGLDADSQYAVKTAYARQLFEILAPYLNGTLTQKTCIPGTVGRAYLRKANPAVYPAYICIADIMLETGVSSRPFGYRQAGSTPALAPSKIMKVKDPSRQVALLNADNQFRTIKGDYGTTLCNPPYGNVHIALFFDWHIESIPFDVNFYHTQNW